MRAWSDGGRRRDPVSRSRSRSGRGRGRSERSDPDRHDQHRERHRRPDAPPPPPGGAGAWPGPPPGPPPPGQMPWGFPPFGPAGFDPAAFGQPGHFDPAACWAQWQAMGGCGGGGDQGKADKKTKKKDKKKKKKKKRKKKRDGSSSSSSSSSSSVSDWRQKVWNGGWQASMWPQMPGAPAGAPQMQGGCGEQAWPQWPGAPGPEGGGGELQPGWMAPREERDWGRHDSRPPEAPPAEDIPVYLEPAIEEFVPVPKALLGKVIGKQAQTIIEIREKSGAFKVDARDQTSDPCQVKIAGTAKAVKKARELIMELLEGTKTKHAGSDFVEIPKAKIGMVIGLKGSQVNDIQQQTGTKIDVDFSEDPCKCYIKGEPQNVAAAKKILLTIAMQLEDGTSEYLELPKTASGAVIGAGGSRVREFQEQSGCRIDVDKTGTMCRVRLTGTREQIANAKQMILAEVDKDRANAAVRPMLPPVHQPLVVPAHQPTSMPATLSESIARAKAAAEAIKLGLVTVDQPGGTMMPPPPPTLGGQLGSMPPPPMHQPPPPLTRPPSMQPMPAGPAAPPAGGGQWTVW